MRQGGTDILDAVALAAGPQEPAQGGAHPQHLLGPAWLNHEIRQCRPHIVPFVVEPVKPVGLVLFEQPLLRSLGQVQLILGVRGSYLVLPGVAPVCQQPFVAVFANGFQQRIAEQAGRALRYDKVLVDQRLQ